MSESEVWPRPHRLAVEDYRRMGEMRLFGADERLELIEGAVVEMPPIGSLHAATVTALAERLTRAVGAPAHVRVQQPLRLGRYSEPRPDIAVVAGTPLGYRAEHPGPEETLLVVDVADATLRFDLEVKARLYAVQGIAEYWVVDLAHRRLHVLRAEGFRSLAMSRRGVSRDDIDVISLWYHTNIVPAEPPR